MPDMPAGCGELLLDPCLSSLARATVVIPGMLGDRHRAQEPGLFLQVALTASRLLPGNPESVPGRLDDCAERESELPAGHRPCGDQEHRNRGNQLIAHLHGWNRRTGRSPGSCWCSAGDLPDSGLAGNRRFGRFCFNQLRSRDLDHLLQRICSPLTASETRFGLRTYWVE